METAQLSMISSMSCLLRLEHSRRLLHSRIWSLGWAGHFSGASPSGLDQAPSQHGGLREVTVLTWQLAAPRMQGWKAVGSS